MRFHLSTKTFLLYLPLLTLLTIAGWTVFGALPGSTMTGDLMSWLMELPVTTCFAFAAVACAAMFKRALLHEIAPQREEALYALAINGNTDARWMIIKDRIEWLALLILFGIFFFPHY